MKQYEAYLFDWDGTIAQTLEVWIEVLRQNFTAYGLDPTDAEIASCMGSFQSRIPELGVKLADLDVFISQVQQQSHEVVPDAPLYPGVRNVLQKLHTSGKKLALITTGWRQTIDLTLSKNGLTDMFDVVITGNDVHAHKPDPAGVLLALEKLNINTSEVVMIGDSEKDLGAAQNSGIDSALFYPVSHQLFYDRSFLEQHNPATIITGWDELLENI